MKLEILERKQKDFNGSEGRKIPYYWYTARTEAGVRITFGSKVGDHNVGQTLELNVEKVERPNGEIGYKEFSS